MRRMASSHGALRRIGRFVAAAEAGACKEWHFECQPADVGAAFAIFDRAVPKCAAFYSPLSPAAESHCMPYFYQWLRPDEEPTMLSYSEKRFLLLVPTLAIVRFEPG